MKSHFQLVAILLLGLILHNIVQAKGISAHSGKSVASVYTSHSGKIAGLAPHYRLTTGRSIYHGYGATKNAGKAILATWHTSTTGNGGFANHMPTIRLTLVERLSKTAY